MNTAKKINVGMIVGLAILVLGIVLIIIKGFTPETVAPDGTLEEAFFLLPLGFGSIFIGAVTMIVSGIVRAAKGKNEK